MLTPPGIRPLIPRPENFPLSTAEKWLSGQLPSNRHMLQMMQAWGRRFVEFVYEPAVGTELKAYALGEELDAIKSHIARLERELDAAASYQVREVSDAAGSPQGGDLDAKG